MNRTQSIQFTQLNEFEEWEVDDQSIENCRQANRLKLSWSEVDAVEFPGVMSDPSSGSRILYPGTSSYLLSEFKLSLIHYIYAVLNPEEVLPFLASNHALLQLLIDVFGRIKCYFPDEPLDLELVKDPEFGNQDLVLSIRTSMSAEEAHVALKQFKRSWWIKNQKIANGQLAFNLIFQ